MVSVQYSYKNSIALGVFLTLIDFFAIAKGDDLKNKNIISQSTTKETDNNTKLAISSGEIIHDSESNRTTAIGNVKIAYNTYRMSADKITFDHQKRRIIASGNIKLIEPNGHQIYAQHIDITDNFKNGEIKDLTINMPNNTYLAATNAKLIDGWRTIFNQGSYTACSACVKQPKSPLFWMVKSKRIVLNRRNHTIRLEKAYLELFGTAVAYLPVIEVPDETITRKTGFLLPTAAYSGSPQGINIVIPYYVVISDSSDATFSLIPYLQQGVVTEVEVRKRFRSGMHTLRGAYMFKRNDQAQDIISTNHQAIISSDAEFKINPTWKFGWNGIIQTHNNSSYPYYTQPLSNRQQKNEVYIKGMGDKYHIDMRTIYYTTQYPLYVAEKQFTEANVLPIIDYRYVEPKSLAGGELSVSGNFTAISREKPDLKNPTPYKRQLWIPYGKNERLTVETEWKRNLIGPYGILLTPMINLRGDFHHLSLIKDPNSVKSLIPHPENIIRGMATTGINMRYPLVFAAKKSQHILEGITQLYLRTNELYAEHIPNEDSQNLVLNSLSLFTRNKFSGFDRVEGGSRANMGIRYTGKFNDLFTFHGTIGQSIHLAGKNSFSLPDPIGAEQNSGLENDKSDYVGAISLAIPSNITLSAQALINRQDLSVRRMDTNLHYRTPSFNTNLSYTHIPERRLYNYPARDILAPNVQFKLNDRFSANASLILNMRDKERIPIHSIGLSYQNDCAAFDISYINESKQPNNFSIKLTLSLRTIGNGSTSYNFGSN
ncbi:MAG: LPS-assembly protein LptD [Candidatus Liberibacter ctenarytainae]|uniref:LPS-assembly protein LptD n=1 Tax=Candidatus Liberibacter ctenarytainae TaxID=2020335 RepID=A0A937AR87_9HYPH|nr:LPS-assembly protein LptD [Candidatus Liberibacter ctenarytainae]